MHSKESVLLRCGHIQWLAAGEDAVNRGTTVYIYSKLYLIDRPSHRICSHN